jgi:hypothetical protein
MIKVALSAAAAFAVVAMMSSAPALADFNFGPIQNGTQCWKDSASRKAEFGYWAACPSTASVATTKRTRRARG